MSIILHESTPTARKEHRCDACQRFIREGETYWRSDNVYDGQRYTWKQCDHCSAVFRECVKADPETASFAVDDGYPELSEWLEALGWNETRDLLVGGWSMKSIAEVLTAVERDRQSSVDGSGVSCG